MVYPLTTKYTLHLLLYKSFSSLLLDSEFKRIIHASDWVLFMFNSHVKPYIYIYVNNMIELPIEDSSLLSLNHNLPAKQSERWQSHDLWHIFLNCFAMTKRGEVSKLCSPLRPYGDVFICILTFSQHTLLYRQASVGEIFWAAVGPFRRRSNYQTRTLIIISSACPWSTYSFARWLGRALYSVRLQPLMLLKRLLALPLAALDRVAPIPYSGHLHVMTNSYRGPVIDFSRPLPHHTRLTLVLTP